MRRSRWAATLDALGPHAAVHADIFLVMLTLGVITPTLSDIRMDLGISYGTVSWAVSIFAVGRMAANLPVARIASRRHTRVPLLLGGTACVACGTLLAAIGPHLVPLLVGRAVAGIGSSAVTTAGTLVVLEGSPDGEHGSASGRFAAALGAGAVTGPALGGLLATVVGWRGSMAITALVLGGFGILLGSTLRKSPPPDGSSIERSSASTSRSPSGGLVHPGAVAAYAATFAVFWARSAIQQTIVPLRGAEVLGMSPLGLSFLLFACSAVATAGTALAGHQLDRRGWERTVPVLLLVMVAGCSVVALSPSVGILVVGALVTAVGLSSGGAPPSMVVDAVAPAERARAVGWTRMVGDVALLGAPVCTGWLADHVGFTEGSVLATAVTAVALVVTLWIARAGVAPSRSRGAEGQVEELR